MIASLDTNVIIRLFVTDSEEQTEAALSCLDVYSRLDIADAAMIEASYILAEWYNFGRSKTIEVLTKLINNPKINCNKTLFSIVLPFYASHPALSIEDCCLATYAHLNNAAPLLTFDRKLANQSPHAQLLKIS